MANFQTKNANLGKFLLKGLSIEDAGIFYGHEAYFGIFCGRLVHLWLFGTFFPVLVCCSKKNLASRMESFTFRERDRNNSSSSEQGCHIFMVPAIFQNG
jgi:hypothetical protein